MMPLENYQPEMNSFLIILPIHSTQQWHLFCCHLRTFAIESHTKLQRNLDLTSNKADQLSEFVSFAPINLPSQHIFEAYLLVQSHAPHTLPHQKAQYQFNIYWDVQCVQTVHCYYVCKFLPIWNLYECIRFRSLIIAFDAVVTNGNMIEVNSTNLNEKHRPNFSAQLIFSTYAWCIRKLLSFALSLDLQLYSPCMHAIFRGVSFENHRVEL